MTIDVNENLPAPVEEWMPGVPIPTLAAALLGYTGLP